MMNYPYRVLLVDDEEQIRSTFVAYFEDYEEFLITAVGSAEEGIDILSREGAHLCIVDMRLPDMDGGAFIRAAAGCCPRFLIHTGSVETELPAELKDLGMSDEDVLIKPCDMLQLLERIRRHMRAM